MTCLADGVACLFSPGSCILQRSGLLFDQRLTQLLKRFLLLRQQLLALRDVPCHHFLHQLGHDRLRERLEPRRGGDLVELQI